MNLSHRCYHGNISTEIIPTSTTYGLVLKPVETRAGSQKTPRQNWLCTSTRTVLVKKSCIYGKNKRCRSFMAVLFGSVKNNQRRVNNRGVVLAEILRHLWAKREGQDT